MIEQSEREYVFIMLSKYLGKKKAATAEKEISTFILEKEIKTLQSEINVNTVVLNGDNVKNGIHSVDEFKSGYAMGVKKYLEIKIERAGEKIKKAQQQIIEILK